MTSSIPGSPSLLKPINPEPRTLCSRACLASILLILAIIPVTVFSTLTLTVSTKHFPQLSINAFRWPEHLPLTTPDTITNRCLLSTKATRRTPCRPLLGHVKKRFRVGTLPQASQVVISDAYRFAFIKTRKTAGTTILYGYLRKNICRPRKHDTLAKHWWKTTSSVPVRAGCPKRLLAPSLESATIPPGIHHIPIEKLQNYFVFAAARNPYERAVSSYEYCNLRYVGSFKDFCERPLSFGSRCPALPNETQTEVTKPNMHWDSQIPEICDSTGTNCVVDYVVDTANITMMMDEVVQEINRRRNKNYPALPKFSGSFTNLNMNNRKGIYTRFYDECPECEDLVKNYYMEDTTMLGYKFPY